MRTVSRTLIPALLAAAVVAGPALAQDSGKSVGERIRESPDLTTRRDPGPATRPYGEGAMARQVEHLIGAKVRGPDGQEIGDVENLLVHPDGKVAGVVVEWGALPAAMGNQVAVPWRDVRLAPDGKSVTVQATREQLESKPKYDPDVPAVAGVDPDVKPLR